ncbi:MAG: hypothetical protein FWD16_01575 [Clostridia bacterium]|nr:hypothetical protein [Clostridia bacterium]
MATTLKGILKKDRWSGDEAGRILLYSLTDNFKRTQEGKPPRPIVAPERMSAMVRGLRSAAEGGEYNRYLDLNNWLQKYYSVALLHCERFKLAATRSLVTVTAALAAENHRIVMEQLTINAGEADNQLSIVNCALSIAVGCPLISKDGALAVDIKAQSVNRAALDEAYYFAMGYNRALSLLAARLRMPDIAVLEMDLQDLTSRADALDKLTAELVLKIKQGAPEEDRRRAALRLIKKLFPPFDPAALTIPEPNITAAREMVEDDLRAFRSPDGGFMELLTRIDN